MPINRRNWLRQIGFGVAGLSLAQIESFASPGIPLVRKAAEGDPIKLSSNENPYGPSPMARKAMGDTMNKSNRYNWELTAALLTAIAEKNKLTTDNLLLGAGSTELLDLTVRMAAANKGKFIIAEPSYMYWTDTAQYLGLKKISVPLTADKRHDLPAMLKAITPDTKLIYICNPNNPTGTVCDEQVLVAFINKATEKTLVLVDEAYLDFTTQQSLAPLVAINKNLVIAKTFSKIYGLAGARVGYAIAHPDTINKLAQFQSWANGSTSVVSTAAALASLGDQSFITETYSLNEKARQYTVAQLEQLNIPCIPSHANFVYFSLAGYKKDFFQQLKNNNILGTKIYEEKGKWSRITIGTMNEMEQFIRAVS